MKIIHIKAIGWLNSDEDISSVTELKGSDEKSIRNIASQLQKIPKR